MRVYQQWNESKKFSVASPASLANRRTPEADMVVKDLALVDVFMGDFLTTK